MVDGFEKNGGVITITRGNRKVVNTGSGTLLCLAPTLHKFTKTITFPKPPMDYWHYWRFASQNSGPISNDPDMFFESSAQVFFTVPPLEQEVVTNLMPVSQAIDFQMVRVRLSRTKEPSKWMGIVPVVRPEQGKWIAWEGSATMEQDWGLCRIMHIVIENGYLCIVAQQSIGPAPGGWGTIGKAAPPGYPAQNGKGSGTVNSFGSKKGMPVWTSSSSTYYKKMSVTYNNVGGGYKPDGYDILKKGKKGSPSTKPPSSLSYESQYKVEVEVQIGRRS